MPCQQQQWKERAVASKEDRDSSQLLSTSIVTNNNKSHRCSPKTCWASPQPTQSNTTTNSNQNYISYLPFQFHFTHTQYSASNQPSCSIPHHQINPYQPLANTSEDDLIPSQYICPTSEGVTNKGSTSFRPHFWHLHSSTSEGASTNIDGRILLPGWQGHRRGIL